MKLGIMQPYFLPYIGYWQLINAVDRFVVYDDVQYIKGGWINRNNIIVNGQKHLINLLLKGASSNKLINEIEIQENQNKLIRTVELNYKKARNFNKVYLEFVKIMEFENKNLGEFLKNSIQLLSDYLLIDTEIILSSDIDEDKELKGEDKVISLCKKLNASHYINAIGGQELYSKNDFAKEGIQLNFIKTMPIEYKQFNNEFIPNLSIIDVMMFNSVEEIRSMLQKYELV